jgi:glycerol uptake facilitator-like aquaporin
VKFSILQRTCAEFLGTAFLVTAVVGSGIMGDRLSNGNTAIALMANSIATGAALVTLILTFGPISGAHFNPVVTIADALSGGLAGVYCGVDRQIPKSSFLCSLRRWVGITHGG